MNEQGRRGAVTALVHLAASRDYRDRADAGSALASFAEQTAARKLLVQLVLDTADTFVTRVTAQALLRRQDSIGLSLVASALATADPNHTDWIHTAVVDVVGVYARDRDAAVRLREAMADDPDEQVRRGAEHLITMLTTIQPVLYPTTSQ
jgi:hypothetical protein